MNFCDSANLAPPQPPVAVAADQLEDERERAALLKCEATIGAGLSTFIAVGNALLEIRDRSLYRMTHGRFDDYCREKWGVSKTHANRLIQASEAVGILTPIGVTPTTESQVRPLAHLPPEQQKEVWRKALEIGGGKPTAKDVKKALEESKPQETRSEFLNKLGVTSSEPIAETDPDDDDPKGLWALKFAWKKAKKSEKSAFLKWVRGPEEAQ